MRLRRVCYGLIAAVLLAGILEVASGLLLLPYYKASSSSAYQSIKSIQSARSTHFLEGFHHWLSAILLAFGGLVILIGLVTAIYRRSSKKVWVSIVILTLLFGFLQLTGHLLPWDVHAVSTAVVETGIAANAPIIGSAQAGLLRAGTQVGPETLQLWFWAHVAVLSLIWLIIAVLALKWMSRQGWSRKWFAAGLAVQLAATVVLALTIPVVVGSPATPADFQNYSAKPEWYVLPLHALVGLFPSNLAFLGSMAIPAVLLLLIVLAPWLESRRSKKPVYSVTLGIILFVGTISLSAQSWDSVASPAGPNDYTAVTNSGGHHLKLDPSMVAKGVQLYGQQGCGNCHTINGKGGQDGPLLDGEGNRHADEQWQIAHLRNPRSVTPSSTMPSFSYLTQPQLQALAEYLLSLKQ